VYLVDTNILSAGSPGAGTAVAGLVEWLDAASPHLFLSVVTASEILSGIALQKRKGATRKAEALQNWWQDVEHLYGSRILPFDLAAATEAGAMLDRARSQGFDPGFPDIAIAATAAARGFTVLTRNVRDFAPLGIVLLNPYETRPPLPT
jgi:predicted nucleic acid-binding protein